MADHKGDNKYVLHIFTGSSFTAGSDANVLITLYGENGESGERLLDNIEDNFEKDKEDIFTIKAKDLGKLSKIKIGHDNTGGGPAWYLNKVVVEDAEDGATYEFECDRWLADDEDDNQIVRELKCTKSTEPTKKKKKKPISKGKSEGSPKKTPTKGQAKGQAKRQAKGHGNKGGKKEKSQDEDDNGYVLHIFTGDKMTAGTDANVLITLYGENGESGERKLDNEENNFEKNKEDTFNIKPKDLGKLTRIKIGHDNSGGGPAWFLNKVVVEDAENGATYEFECDRWLADDEDDNQIVRELECTKSTDPTKEKKKKDTKSTKDKGQKGGAKGKKATGKKDKSKDDNGYVLHIFTGDKMTAGSDANVLITLYGENGESGERKLDNEENNFEKNKEDVFNIKAKDLGKLSKIKIGHDNSGAGPAWFLDKVVIHDEEDGATYTFECNRWLADDKDDDQIVRELECSESTEPTKEKKNKKEEEGEAEDEEVAADNEEGERKRQFEAEFARLKESLEKESTRIVKPEFKPYSPFIFSSLEPYHNTYTVEFILDYPDHVKHGFITRKTAVGLVDPEVSHRMDIELDEVPPSTPRSPRVENPEPKLSQDDTEKEGSTRLPKWPIVEIVKTGPMAKEILNWGDVPKLREELRTKYSSNAQERRKKDYQRTKQDWTRMELEKLKDIHEVNRSHMQVTCTTYLGTSIGGKAAVKSLAKVLE